MGRFLFSARWRRWRFVAVGGFCFTVQLCVLHGLRLLGVAQPVANAIGFALSAQVNFVLSSRLTWGDRTADDARTVIARFASYNAAALVSLAVNTLVFTMLYGMVGATPAAAAGVVCGMGLTYLGCDRLIFRARRPSASRNRRSLRPSIQEHIP